MGRRLWPLVDILMPLSFVQPALCLSLPIQSGWKLWDASYWDSLVFTAPFFIFLRLAMWVDMHLMMRKIKQVRGWACM